LKNSDIYIGIKAITITFAITFIFFSCKQEFSPTIIINPYENVNWKSWWQYKSSLHTHTNISDGHLSPNQLVDEYNRLDYKILCITDHNKVTFPWENFDSFSPSIFGQEFVNEGIISAEDTVYQNRYPEEIGMLTFPGNEHSNHHHLASYFINYQSLSTNIKTSLNGICENNGLAFLCHPIKYSYDINWYKELYNTYQCLVGIEVYNKKYDSNENFYFDDFYKWDSLLDIFMPYRNIYGFANDDFHTNEMGYGYCMFLMPEFSENWAKKSMQNGNFYFAVTKGHDRLPHPRIESIDIDNFKISIEASNYETIEWVSSGIVVAKGNVIDVLKLENNINYVRAMIYSENKQAFVGTQAFGIQRLSTN